MTSIPRQSTGGATPLPRLEVDLRNGLVRLRKNLGKLHELPSSPYDSLTQVVRLRSVSEDFSGDVPLRPGYEARN